MALLAATLLVSFAVLALCSRGRLLPMLLGLVVAVAWTALRLLGDPSVDEAEASRLLLERGEDGFARYRAVVALEAVAPLVVGTVVAFVSSRRAVRRMERGER